MRTPVPLDRGPSLVASLNLTHLPKSPMSNVLTWGASALTYGWGGVQFSLENGESMETAHLSLFYLTFPHSSEGYIEHDFSITLN